MFSLLDVGVRSGSGIQSIFQVLEEQNYSTPEHKEMFNLERTVLTLPFSRLNILLVVVTERWR